jgi:hypothetical protein
MHEKLLQTILRSDKTVFSFKELLFTYRAIGTKILKSRLNYYVRNGDLYHIRRGLYAKDKQYDRLELATKILAPSYISFETVLRSAGIIFQYSTEITLASYQSRTIICDGQTYIFKKLKPIILTNSIGIEIRQEYSIASPERAFLDTVYLYKNYHFDNLEPLNWEKVFELLPLYNNNKSMLKRVAFYHQSFKNEKQKTGLKQSSKAKHSFCSS